MAAAEPARDDSRAATETQALRTGVEGQLAAHGWRWARTGRAAAGRPWGTEAATLLAQLAP